MSQDRAQVERLLTELSPAAQRLAKTVLRLENEHLHVKEPSQLADQIVREVKGLIK